MPKKKALKAPQIMKSVDILDLVNILVMQTAPGHFNIDFECRQPEHQVVFYGKTRETLENMIYEASKDKVASDPNTRGYIEEFTGRMLQKLKEKDLVDIVPLDAPIDDHFASIKQQLAKTGKLS